MYYLFIIYTIIQVFIDVNIQLRDNCFVYIGISNVLDEVMFPRPIDNATGISYSGGNWGRWNFEQDGQYLIPFA